MEGREEGGPAGGVGSMGCVPFRVVGDWRMRNRCRWCVVVSCAGAGLGRHHLRAPGSHSSPLTLAPLSPSPIPRPHPASLLSPPVDTDFIEVEYDDMFSLMEHLQVRAVCTLSLPPSLCIHLCMQHCPLSPPPHISSPHIVVCSLAGHGREQRHHSNSTSGFQGPAGCHQHRVHRHAWTPRGRGASHVSSESRPRLCTCTCLCAGGTPIVSCNPCSPCTPCPDCVHDWVEAAREPAQAPVPWLRPKVPEGPVNGDCRPVRDLADGVNTILKHSACLLQANRRNAARISRVQ